MVQGGEALLKTRWDESYLRAASAGSSSTAASTATIAWSIRHIPLRKVKFSACMPLCSLLSRKKRSQASLLSRRRHVAQTVSHGWLPSTMAGLIRAAACQPPISPNPQAANFPAIVDFAECLPLLEHARCPPLTHSAEVRIPTSDWRAPHLHRTPARPRHAIRPHNAPAGHRPPGHWHCPRRGGGGATGDSPAAINTCGNNGVDTPWPLRYSAAVVSALRGALLPSWIRRVCRGGPWADTGLPRIVP
jgi:hypothetical protein